MMVAGALLDRPMAQDISNIRAPQAPGECQPLPL